jgi:hypothetical protein
MLKRALVFGFVSVFVTGLSGCCHTCQDRCARPAIVSSAPICCPNNCCPSNGCNKCNGAINGSAVPAPPPGAIVQ